MRSTMEAPVEAEAAPALTACALSLSSVRCGSDRGGGIGDGSTLSLAPAAPASIAAAEWAGRGRDRAVRSDWGGGTGSADDRNGPAPMVCVVDAASRSAAPIVIVLAWHGVMSSASASTSSVRSTAAAHLHWNRWGIRMVAEHRAVVCECECACVWLSMSMVEA